MRLQIEEVNAGYDGSTVLWGINLEVPNGEVVALLGPNGAGKTTLLSVASGLIRPQSGRILLDGRDVTDLSSDARARLGLCHVTEGRSIFPGLTVRENLRLFAKTGREPEAMERAVSAFPKLAQRLSQVAGTLSGGEQQMLALARAYAQEPKLVLLDEVSLGLAPIVVDEIFAFLGRLAAEGAALLIVEQYVSKALRLASEVSILARGRIVVSGNAADLASTDILSQYLGSEVGQVA